MLLSPMFWSSTQHLKMVAKDSFVADMHERLSFLFVRNEIQLISAVELIGFNDEKGLYTWFSDTLVPI